jgi:hypothetical protein
VKDSERARSMCALAAVEINMSELRDIEGFWDLLGPDGRHVWLEELAKVRAYQHALQNPEVKSRGKIP